MSKKIIGVIGLILVLGLAGLVFAKMTPYSQDGYNHNVEVYVFKGWNLVLNFDFDDTTKNSEITKENIKASYYFDTDRKEYLQIYPEDSKYSDYISNVPIDMQSYLRISPIWIYSNKEGYLRYPRIDVPKYYEVALEDGWNFITVTPEMVGKSFNEINAENCEIIKIAAWEEQEWDVLTNEQMDKNHFFEVGSFLEPGRGFAIKVLDDCGLGYSVGGDGTNPPGLPGDSECTDSDNGIVIDVRGDTIGDFYDSRTGETRDEMMRDVCIKDPETYPSDIQAYIDLGIITSDSSEDPNILIESYCSNDMIKTEAFDCSERGFTSCQNGICI